MNKKYLILGLCFVLGIVVGFCVNISFFPTKTDLQPSNYFTNLNENSIINLADFVVYQSDSSPSMLPCLPNNSVSLAVKSDNYSVGDFIIFDFEGFENPLVHMVIEKQNGKYLTQGVNMKYNDKVWTSQEDIYGKVVGVLF